MKKLRFPKPKKISKSRLTKKCDTLFSLIVRSIGHCEASPYVKVTCGGQLQTCHIVGRSNRRLRWNTMNALCMCAGHHRYFTTHADEWYWDFIPSYFPLKHEYVQRHRNEIVDTIDYEKILTGLQQLYDSLQVTKQ